MKKILTLSAVALAMTVMSGASFAVQGGEGNNTDCNGNGNPNSPCQPSTPPSSGGAGGSANVDVDVYNKAYGGSATAYGGSAKAYGGNATGGSVTGSGNSTNDNRSSATGGSVTGSGNSTVGPVGSVGNVSGVGNTVKSLSPEANANSTNLNTNTALGGSATQGQQQGQQQAQKQDQVNVQGQANSQSVKIDQADNRYTVKAAEAAAKAEVEAAKINADAARDVARIMDDVTVRNVPSVNGPALTSSNDTCMGSSSGSVNAPGIGVGFGTTWTDENCKMLKNSRELWNMGMKAAALALMCGDAKNREALEVTGYKCPTGKPDSSAQAAPVAPAATSVKRDQALPGFAMHAGN